MELKLATDERYRQFIESTDTQSSSGSSATTAGELFRFTNPSLSSGGLSSQHQQWTTGHLINVTMRVGDHRVQAQRDVLSAVSSYFETLLSTDMNEEIELRDIDGKAVEMLVQYAHTGSIDITGDNVSALIKAAKFLCIDSVTEACLVYLENNLTIDNYLDAFGLSVSCGQASLRDSVERFIVENFKDLTFENHIMKMPSDLLLQLLDRDDVVVMGDGFYGDPSMEEEKILELLLRYVESDPEGRRRDLPLLLSRGVRLMLLTPSTLKTLQSSRLIASSPESLNLVSQALSLEATDEELKQWTKPRIRLVLHHQKTKVLAGTVLLQSEIPGKVFDDSESVPEGQCVYVTGLKVCIRRWGDGRPIVGGLKVFYNTGGFMLHGSDGYGYEDHEFHLDPDERIVSVNASSGWLIDRITFASNLGKTYGPYGGYGGTQHYMERPCKRAYLAYFTGSVELIQGETALRHIRFIWGFYTR